MDERESPANSLLQNLLAVHGSEEEALDLLPMLNQTSHHDIHNVVLGKYINAIQEKTNADDFIRKITFVILEHLASENNKIIQDSSQEILWQLCIKNVKNHYDSDNHSVPKQYKKILEKWIGRILLKPEMCSDPHLLLELMCLIYTFDLDQCYHFPHFWSEMDVGFIIIIYQIDVDKYLSSCLDDKLLNFNMLDQILDRFKYAESATPSKSFTFEAAAKRLDKISLSELTIHFCSNIIELLSQTLLMHIKCRSDECILDMLDISYEGFMDIVSLCGDVSTFFAVYFKISAEISNVHLEKHPLIKGSKRSAIATITNCIYILKSKLEIFSEMPLVCGRIYKMEKFRDHMARADLGTDFKISVEQFLAGRSLGNFDISHTKKLYGVTTNIKEIRNKSTKRTSNESQEDDLLNLDDDLRSNLLPVY